jgi:hypothetical protein
MTESNSDAPGTDGIAGAAKLVQAGLRGDALDGAEQKASVEHRQYEQARNPDAELRLDGEDESLYSDGLDIGDHADAYAGTDGDATKGFKG